MTTRFAVASRVAGHSTSARTAPERGGHARVDEPDAVSCSACGSALASSTRSHSAGSSASAHTRPMPAARHGLRRVGLARGDGDGQGARVAQVGAFLGLLERDRPEVAGRACARPRAPGGDYSASSARCSPASGRPEGAFERGSGTREVVSGRVRRGEARRGRRSASERGDARARDGAEDENNATRADATEPETHQRHSEVLGVHPGRTLRNLRLGIRLRLPHRLSRAPAAKPRRRVWRAGRKRAARDVESNRSSHDGSRQVLVAVPVKHPRVLTFDSAGIGAETRRGAGRGGPRGRAGRPPRTRPQPRNPQRWSLAKRTSTTPPCESRCVDRARRRARHPPRRAIFRAPSFSFRPRRWLGRASRSPRQRRSGAEPPPPLALARSPRRGPIATPARPLRASARAPRSRSLARGGVGVHPVPPAEALRAAGADATPQSRGPRRP